MYIVFAESFVGFGQVTAVPDFVSNKKFVFFVFSSHASRTEDLITLITLITLIKWPWNSPDLNPIKFLVLDENSAPGEDHVHIDDLQREIKTWCMKLDDINYLKKLS